MMAYYFRSRLLAQVKLLSAHILAVRAVLVKAFSLMSHKLLRLLLYKRIKLCYDVTAYASRFPDRLLAVSCFYILAAQDPNTAHAVFL
jgi:hypothetical protein